MCMRIDYSCCARLLKAICKIGPGVHYIDGRRERTILRLSISMAGAHQCAHVPMQFCSYCDFRCYNQRALLKHLRDLHQNDPSFRVFCTLCGMTFRKWCSLKKHLHRDHDGNCSPPTHVAREKFFVGPTRPLAFRL